jgi:hypothetical protein
MLQSAHMTAQWEKDPQFRWESDPTKDSRDNIIDAVQKAEDIIDQERLGSPQLNAIADQIDLLFYKHHPVLPDDVKERRVGHIEETIRRDRNRVHGYPEGLKLAKELVAGVVRVDKRDNRMSTYEAEQLVTPSVASLLMASKDRVIERKNQQPPPPQPR